MELLTRLNPVQREAVQHTEGPLLILAGAGSGKTRVLTYRIAYLIREKGVSPFNILAITFTNKAAREMQERIEGLIGHRESQNIWVSTFHAACVRILRREMDHLGYDSSFAIYDTHDQGVVIKECLRELDMDEKRYNPQAVLSQISKAKNELIGAREFVLMADNYFSRKVGDIYELYEKKLRQNNAFDFDDLIMKTVMLFRQRPDILEAYQNRFRYILVDEYQDTNHAQYVLVNLLAEKNRNLCVVGDDDQSIYGWRGANIRNILDFEQDYPETRVIKLVQNYRSTKKILQAANEVIKHNWGRKEKQLWTENPEGELIHGFQAANEHEEALYIAQEIAKMQREEGRGYASFAVLYRTNAQSRVLEETFLKLGIPYRVVGGVKFYERKEIKDIIAYLRLLANHHDTVSLKRIINVPKRGIGNATVEKLEQAAWDGGISIWEVLSNLDGMAVFNGGTVKKLQQFKFLIETFEQLSKELPLPRLVEELLGQTGYLAELQQENTPESMSRLENIKEFITVAAEFVNRSQEPNLVAFLEEIALIADIDTYEEGEEAVTLMTLHSAKGLEFPVVFMPGMEETIFPHSRSMYEESELEEERRLCYVGITRAQEKLYLTSAESRTLYGSTTYNSISRFLQEIPQELFAGEAISAQRERASVAWGKSKMVKSQLSQEKGDFKPGDKIRHEKWGIGTVVSTLGSGEELELTAAFDNQGVKKLLVAYAPITKV